MGQKKYFYFPGIFFFSEMLPHLVILMSTPKWTAKSDITEKKNVTTFN